MLMGKKPAGGAAGAAGKAAAAGGAGSDEQDLMNMLMGGKKRPSGGAAGSGGVRWRPELSDEFNNTGGLEGVTTGTLGSKWLFKQEQPAPAPPLWSVGTTPGWLSLRTNCTGIDVQDFKVLEAWKDPGNM